MRIDLKDVAVAGGDEGDIGFSPLMLSRQLCKLRESSERIAEQNQEIVALLRILVNETKRMSSKGDAILDVSGKLNQATDRVCSVMERSNDIMVILQRLMEQLGASNLP